MPSSPSSPGSRRAGPSTPGPGGTVGAQTPMDQPERQQVWTSPTQPNRLRASHYKDLPATPVTAAPSRPPGPRPGARARTRRRARTAGVRTRPEGTLSRRAQCACRAGRRSGWRGKRGCTTPKGPFALGSGPRGGGDPLVGSVGVWGRGGRGPGLPGSAPTAPRGEAPWGGGPAG